MNVQHGFFLLILFQVYLTVSADWEDDFKMTLDRELRARGEKPPGPPGGERPRPTKFPMTDVPDFIKAFPRKYWHVAIIIKDNLDPFFNEFPSGEFTDTFDLDPNTLVNEVRTAYEEFKNSADTSKKVFFEMVFRRVAALMLGARFRCATTKLQEIIVYVISESLQEDLEKDDGTLFSTIHAILENELSGHTPTKIQEYTNMIVSGAHKRIYGRLMGKLVFNEFEDTFVALRSLFRTLRRMSPEDGQLETKLKDWASGKSTRLMCRTWDQFLDFHKRIAHRFRQRLTKSKIVKMMEKSIREMFGSLPGDTSNMVTKLTEVFRNYLSETANDFKEYEVTITKDADELRKYFKRHLEETQFTYFESIVSLLTGEGSGGDMTDDTGLDDTESDDTGSDDTEDDTGSDDTESD